MAEASSTSSNPLATFQFTAIGQAPALLKRLSAPEEVGGQDFPPSPSPSPLSSPKEPTSSIPRPKSSRRSLLASLAGIEESNMEADNAPVQAASEASRTSGSSGASARVAPNGAPSSASVGKPRLSPAMNGSRNASRTPPSQAPLSVAVSTGAATNGSALNALLPVPSPSLAAVGGLSPAVTERPSLQQDDAIDAFRRALQRLHAESEEYSRREEETRHAMARQQDQAARWHARADALLDSFSGLFAQCERKVASASHAVAEVERLQALVRQKEEEADETRRRVASLETEKAELDRALEDMRSRSTERLRLMEANAAELRRAAEAAASEKAAMEAALRDLNAAIETAKRESLAQTEQREHEFQARLEEQKRIADREKQELLRQLQEQKRLTEQEKQKRMAGLVAERLRLEEQLRAEMEEQMRAHAYHGSGAPPSAAEPRAAEERARVDASMPSVSAIQSPAAELSAQNSAILPISRSGAVLTAKATPPHPSAPAPAANAGNPAFTRHASHPSPLQDLKPLTIPDVERQLPPDVSPVEYPTVKREVITPSLPTVQPESSTSHRAPRPVETPIAKRVKREPSTLGRKPSFMPSSTPPQAAGSRVTSQLMPEAPTVLDPIYQQSGTDAPHDIEPLRREQSLDYEPGPARPSGLRDNAPLSGGVRVSTGAPAATRTSGHPSKPALQDRISSGLPPMKEGSNMSGPGTPSPAMSSGLSSSEFPPPLSSLPDLAYPSREDSPTLMTSTSSSGDRPAGLGIIDAHDGGTYIHSGQRSRGPTPPPVEAPPNRGRAQRKIQRVADHYSPVAKPVQTTWEPDHWSPSPGRELPRREAYSPPVRHKRTREDDSPARSTSRRARVSPPDAERPRFAAPPPRRISERYEPGPSTYDERSRSRSPRPGQPPAQERSRSPPRNPYALVSPPQAHYVSPIYYPPPQPPSHDPPSNYCAFANGWHQQYRPSRTDLYATPMQQPAPNRPRWPPPPPPPRSRAPLEHRLRDAPRLRRRVPERDPY
ncbi:hypothetical protein BV20DRAFT_603083 [Pilatotrama ljubarskyi]|nr:hypothetical protein BV20DRAFT_603083 [Pilatotrama ljubarskyi]